MSRSYQHHSLRNKFKEAYYSVVCYFSNKKSKRLANQIFRSKNKQILKRIKDGECDDDIEFFNKVREVSNTYDFDSDGLSSHHYLDEPKDKDDVIFNKKLCGK